MLQAFLFIVTLPLTNVFCHFSDTDFQLWLLEATFWPVDRQSSNALYFWTYQALQKPTESQHIPNPIMDKVVGGSQFACLQVVWGALNYCKNHNILFHVPSGNSKLICWIWSADQSLYSGTWLFFKDGPGCDKLTRGHQNPATFSWMFQHLFGTENPKPPRCISSTGAERFQKLTQRRRRLPSWKQTKKRRPKSNPAVGEPGFRRALKGAKVVILIASYFFASFCILNMPTFQHFLGHSEVTKKETVPFSIDIFQIYSEVSLANNFQDTRTCP